MSDINFGTQGRNVCMGFCKKVSVCKLQRGEYLMRGHDFGKNPLPARVMEEDTSPFAREPKKCHLTPSHPPTTHPPTTHPPLCGSLLIAEYEIICSKYGKCYWSVGTPIFLVKRASNSQDTVDYIVQRAARKNSSGFPGLTRLTLHYRSLPIQAEFSLTAHADLCSCFNLTF